MLANPTSMAKRGAAALLALLMCSMSLATVSADTLHAVHDEAVLVVTGEAGSTWSGNLSLDAEQRVSSSPPAAAATPKCPMKREACEPTVLADCISPSCLRRQPK